MSNYTKKLAVVLFPVAAVFAALCIGSILIFSIGINPITAYGVMFKGIAENRYAIGTVFVKATPLFITGMGLAYAFRAGIFNIGAEGQIYFGALFGTIVGILDIGIPAPLHILICLIASFIGGGIWASIPGFLKAKYSVNEIITTILMNYISSNLITYLARGPLRDNQKSLAAPQQTAEVMKSARLPIIIQGTRLHFGFVIAIIIMITLAFVMYRTSFGFKCKLVGLNPEASRYAGLNVISLGVLAMVISGGLCGVAGTIEILGVQRRLRGSFIGNTGFKAIAVALLGKNNPIAILFTSLLFGALEVGANSMESLAGVPSPIIETIQSIVIFLIALGALFEPKEKLKKSKDQENDPEVVK